MTLSCVSFLAWADEMNSLEKLVAEDEATPVALGGVEGRPFWNEYSLCFRYPPAFAFKEKPGAAAYRFEVRDDHQQIYTMTAAKPTAPLTEVWAKIPAGLCAVNCYALDAAGEIIDRVGSRRFWRSAPFKPGSYPEPKRTYREARDKFIDFLVDNWGPTRVLYFTGRPDFTYQYNCYPAKIGASLINVMTLAAKVKPEKAEKALKIAKAEADYLIEVTPKTGPLAYLAPTYEVHEEGGGHRFAIAVAKKYAEFTMLRYPAEVAIAMVNLYRATKEKKYLDFALSCGETYRRLRRPDGSWPVVMRYKDGAAVNDQPLLLIERIDFFTKLYEETGDESWKTMEEDVFRFIEKNQMKTFDWTGQFEDTMLAEKPYTNLTHHDAIATALYILKKFPGDPKRLAQARELVRFCEDQFVFWERPCRSDGAGPSDGQAVEGKWYDCTYASWRCPGVGEQYACYVPIDASACRLIRAYLALDKALGGNAMYAEKARTMGNALVREQLSTGGIHTYWYDDRFVISDACTEIDWLDCMVDDVEALDELVKTE